MTKVVTGGKRVHTYADRLLSSGARDVAFGLSFRLLPYFVISACSGETVNGQAYPSRQAHQSISWLPIG